MIKILAAASRDGHQIELEFSDDSRGVYDFSRFVEAGTEMTAPLADPAFFASYFIEAGALAWPNGSELSARSLQQTLRERGALVSGRHIG